MASTLPTFGRRALPMLDMPKLGGGGKLKLLGFEVITVAGAFTRSPPSGASILVARAYGGGGSGGCKNLNGGSNEYGGQGGDYASGSAILPANTSITGTVGAGGAGVTSAGSRDGLPGGTTTVSVGGTQIVSVAGGPGGTPAGAPVINADPAAARDLTGNPVPSLGHPTVIPSVGQGAGAAAAGPEGGAGGAVPATNAPGNPGVSPGGGGSQASNVQNTTTASGSGAAGAVYLHWYGAA